MHLSLIPLITHFLGSSRQLIVVEEPEQNLHPSLEASLADLLVHSYKTLHNECIIETHSEHLVMGLLNKIKKKEISNNDISINFAEIKDSKTSIKELKIDKDGNFITDWPDGFLPDTLDSV